MKLSKSLLALVATAMIAGMSYAEEGAEKKPDAPKAEKKAADTKAKPIRFKPYSLIDASLTAEQREKVNAIHATYLDDVKKAKEKEDTEIRAVLTDDQKKELDAAAEKDKAAGKTAKEKPAEKAAEKKE